MSWRITPTQPVPVDLQGIGSVSLLLHGNGTNGSTTITDSSPTPKTVTAVGNAQISTAQSKFGGASIAFDGTVGTYVNLSASSSYVMNSDFTIEFWIYPTTQSNQATLDQFTTVAFGQGSWQHFLTAGGSMAFYYNGGASFAYPGYPTLNAWSHIAIVRSQGIIKQYLNGTAGTGINFTGQVGRNDTLWLGAQHLGLSNFLNGNLDEVRITNGIARYTANFTPPTAPFPDI